tara:strand:+ start:977 stop:1621 length:645 start_codon:yes stop_codon:yes gene_type:complete
MIIQCKSCSRKFVVKDRDIPEEGRMVQCGYCSVNWHQMPVVKLTKTTKQTIINKPQPEMSEGLSVDKIKASDGKTYKFLGSQWAELLPSGKTGLFARKKIGKELDKLTGRKERKVVKKKQKKSLEMDPSGVISTEKQLPEIYKPKQGIGFFGYIFLLIVIGFSLIGVLKTFESDLLNYFPEAEYLFELIDEQLEYISESVKNIIVLVNDLINSY